MMVLGYTRSGHAVLLPTAQKADMDQFVSWTPGDHLDASRILVEHGERTADPQGAWCEQLADVHRVIGGFPKKKRKKRKKRKDVQIRGAVEAVILSRGRR